MVTTPIGDSKEIEEDESSQVTDTESTDADVDTRITIITPVTDIISTDITTRTIPNFVCTSVGRFPYPGSCTKYYYCWNTVNAHAIFSCPKVFHPETRLCVDNYAVCLSTPNCTHDKQIFANPDDKYSFLECKFKHGANVYEIRRGECEKGREFDRNLGFCKLSTEDMTLDSSVDGFECTTVGKFIDYRSDTHYIQCVVENAAKGTFKPCRKKCPSNTIFNGIDMMCQPANPSIIVY